MNQLIECFLNSLPAVTEASYHITVSAECWSTLYFRKVTSPTLIVTWVPTRKSGVKILSNAEFQETENSIQSLFQPIRTQVIQQLTNHRALGGLLVYCQSVLVN